MLTDEQIESERAEMEPIIGPTRSGWYAEACKVEWDAHDTIKDIRTPIIGRVRLDVGDGYLEVRPSPCGRGLRIYHGILGDDLILVVRPEVSNVVRVLAIPEQE